MLVPPYYSEEAVKEAVGSITIPDQRCAIAVTQLLLSVLILKHLLV